MNASDSLEYSTQMEAAAEDPTPSRVEEAGPLTQMNHDSPEIPLPSHLSPSQNSGMEETTEHGDEQPLESHEVMELQAFSERKEWIMEKINVRIPGPPLTTVLLPDNISEKAPGGHASHRAFRQPGRRACLDSYGVGAPYPGTTRTVALRAQQA